MPSFRSQNLGSYLDSLGTFAKTMSFAAIEAVLGQSLPPIARRDRTWWLNRSQPTSTRWKAFCGGTGWECVHIDPKNEFAIFRTPDDVPVQGVAASIEDSAEERAQDADVLEQALIERTDIGPTQKQQLIKARRGQGLFRINVQLHEKSCRLTRVSDPGHLRASHIKPWKDSSDSEKIDGSNGLFLAPHIDHLFDRGFISFDDSGQLLISSALAPTIAKAWSIAASTKVGSFTKKQKKYLAYHRQNVFKN